mmetsp:Transcript_27936/g.42028  ORF Transcript_27936/g.42028 Transcript_27936/m.42028 type:complete len:93 (+) Transcript_27936:475-753(+)
MTFHSSNTGDLPIPVRSNVRRANGKMDKHEATFQFNQILHASNLLSSAKHTQQFVDQPNLNEAKSDSQAYTTTPLATSAHHTFFHSTPTQIP